MSLTFLDMQINKMSLEEINEMLNSSKYISLLKREKLTAKKNLLESKDLTLTQNFPNLNISEPEPEPEPESSYELQSKSKIQLKGAWNNKSSKIYDNSNAPVINKKSTLVSKPKKKVVEKQVEYYSDDDQLIDDYDGY